ncbi:MAG: hypothetical protein GY851_34765, partial [bacterium]|nr:hypothetical protein [bacterium]
MREIGSAIGLLGVIVVGVMWAGHAQAAPLKLKEEQYKRIHQETIRAAVDGNTRGAIEALDDYLEKHQDDAESWFALAVAHAHAGSLDDATQSARKAIDCGLPMERLVAEWFFLLAPLSSGSSEFREFVETSFLEPVHGPMIGRVTSSSASFWVRTARDADVRIRIIDCTSLREPIDSPTVHTSADADFVGIVTVNDLAPDTTYAYEVVVDGHVSKAQEVQSFTTSPASGAPGTFTIGFGGGAGFVPQHEHMWDTIVKFQPRAFLFLGDNIYSDDPTRPYMQRYCYHRRQSRPEYRRFAARTPIYAIWDDHDFGTNDCWGGPDIRDPEWKVPVWKLFRTNWVNPYWGGGEANPGCWFDFSMGDVDFIMLDGRYYRTDPKKPNPSMLGPVQR